MFDKYDIKCLKLFKEAERQREILHHEYVGTEHLLLAILNNNPKLEKQLGINYDLFYKEVKMAIAPVRKKITNNIYTPLLKKIINKSLNDVKVDETKLLFHILDEGEGVAIRILLGMGIDIDSLYNLLKNNLEIDKHIEFDSYGNLLNNTIDLNEKVVGREKEINLIIETLLRKKKNNPLLVGDAGVGKSAIVEELARRIVKKEVPEQLLDAKIIMLDMASILSGTKYRGEFEEKLTTLITKIKDNPNIILFIDEIHTLVNAGASEGAISASDILKPYLARGDIKCIGATTKKEYEKYFVKDKALSRRFELLLVEEPNEEETFAILKSIKEEYINFHKINISDDLLKSLVHLTKVYFPNKYNPDKSIELLDSVMSFVKLKKQSKIIKDKENDLKKIELTKIKLIENGDFKKALQTNILEDKIKKELQAIKNNNQIFITSEDIMDILEYKNNIINNRKIKIINSYDKSMIRLINNTLKKPGVKSFKTNDIPDSIIENIAKEINYQVIKLNSEKSIEKMFNKVKYYPSTIIIASDNVNEINSILTKIYKDGLVEHNDEYINFNNVIFFIKTSNKSMGFNANAISNVPYDEILEFKTNKIPA
ncbi:MAG: ATP-dependent Clp protease ATP-binding subunit [Bacilli bacterium]|nr:ATP-dependent Clp protease ATP-binding subunit [Bacilli bacterium]